MDKLTYSVNADIFYHADVAVVGGGVAGCAAAVAAARNGANTILIENNGCLGGLATVGHVSPFDATHDRNNNSFGGIAQEILDRMDKAQEHLGFKENGMKREAPNLLKWVLLEMLTECGVKILFHTGCLDAVTEQNTIKYLVLSTKSGIRALKANMFIDASGDGDLIYRSGAKYYKGAEADTFKTLSDNDMDKMHFEADRLNKSYENPQNGGGMQPCSIMFTMGNIDLSKDPTKYNNVLLKYGDLGITREAFEKLPYFGTPGFEENGDYIPLPQGRILLFHTNHPNELLVNMSRIIGVDATDAEQLNDAEIKAQKQIIYIADFLKRFVPGFENSYLVESGDTLGVRESRRLAGKYLLSGDDAINCRHFDDDVACGSYMIDIHDPYGKKKAIGGFLRGASYGIPYRSLISNSIDNLLACGRCISADHVAHASTRIQGTCTMTGQAAGTAAALSVSGGISPSELSSEALREKLITDGLNI